MKARAHDVMIKSLDNFIQDTTSFPTHHTVDDGRMKELQSLTIFYLMYQV